MPLEFSPGAYRLLTSGTQPRRTNRLSPGKTILAVNGHPDPSPDRFCAALCKAYCDGARSAGWNIEMLSLGLSPEDVSRAEAGAHDLANLRDLLRSSDCLAVFFPLWLDQPPPDVARFLDLVREHCAGETGLRRGRLFVTMGMPAFLHRQMYRAREGVYAAGHAMHLHGLASRDPVFIGGVDVMSAERRRTWLKVLHGFGKDGV